MSITLELLKTLREKTGVSMQACKNALEETNGDIDKAIEYLRKKGEVKAAGKSDRETSEGVIASYVHSNKKLGALVLIQCETDFVARNEDFLNFCNDVAMHVAAANPSVISAEEVSAEEIAKEYEIWKEQLKNEGKPENIWEKILEGKEKKFREEKALLTQNFVKNPELTVQKLLTDMITKMGENVKISKFSRYEI